ncbi:MAG: fluoride efflux transporter CrcB [Salinisphaeraceae bacterium]|nr:fluoride efflux transporter CrcB [Salinisphaeraceae bacterium]
MMQLLYVAAGGAVGALLRYGVVLLSQNLWGRDFPYGTLLVNVLGSLLIGLAYVWIVERLALGDAWRLAFMVGVLGAFTTFSSFSIETLQLVERGAALAALSNILLNVSLCLVACWLGLLAARQF